MTNPVMLSGAGDAVEGRLGELISPGGRKVLSLLRVLQL
jgi:hypothetical protein